MKSLKYIPLDKRTKRTAGQSQYGVIATQADTWRTRANNKPLRVIRSTHAN